MQRELVNLTTGEVNLEQHAVENDFFTEWENGLALTTTQLYGLFIERCLVAPTTGGNATR